MNSMKQTKSMEEKMKNLEKMLETISDDMKEVKDKRFNEKIARMRFVGVIFDPEKYKAGEDKINVALDEGFEVMRDFETGGGIVMCMAKWEKKIMEEEK